MLNEIDRQLLRRLQADPAIPVAELARVCGIQPATATRRLDRLRAEGVLMGERYSINWVALGYAVEVSLRVTLDKTQPRAFDEFMENARKIREVVEMQTFLGRVDVRLSIIAKDMAHYQSLYRNRILTLPHIADIEALMHVATIKTAKTLPI